MAKKESKLVLRDKEQKEGKKGYVLTADEAKQYAIIVDKVVRAREQRESPSDYFDGLNYSQVYLANKRAAHSYLQPKRNDDEVRINTGTTEKRIELVLNELLSLNLEGEVRAFDRDDNLFEDVGQVFTDITKRTEEIEMSRDKDITIFQELLTQPSVFVEELWIEEPKLNKKGGIRKRCDRRLLQGIQMYLGDINLPDTRWNDQPYLIKYSRMLYTEGEKLFKGLNPEKWESVKGGDYSTLGGLPNTLYRKGSITYEEVEAFYYMSYPDNELQIIVNGIPFLDPGHKYTDEYGDLGGYHITMVSLKPFGGDSAYGKPLTQSSKTLQALENENIRLLIRKFRQAIEPPMGTPAGKVFSRDIWNPGAMVQGVKKDDFNKLIDHQGVTQSEFAMFDLMEKKVNEFIGTSQTEPLQGKTSVTATELRLARNNAIKMLGNAVLAVMRLKSRLTMLRVRNVLINFTKPTGKRLNPISDKLEEVYARFSLEGQDVGDAQGTKIIQMMDRKLTGEEEMGIFKEEQKSRKTGKPFQFRTVNIPALQDLDLYFFVAVSANERESSDLDKAMMTEMINQGSAIVGLTGRPMNPDKIIQKFERVYKERDLFQKEAPSQQQAQVQGGPASKAIKPTIGGPTPEATKIADIV